MTALYLQKLIVDRTIAFFFAEAASKRAYAMAGTCFWYEWNEELILE